MKKVYINRDYLIAETETEFIVYEPPKMPFWQKLAIYCTAWLVILLGAGFITYSVAVQYNAATPKYAIEQYVSLAKDEIFFDAISSAVLNLENKHEPLYRTAGRLSANYTGRFSYVKLANEYTDENPVYVIRHDGEDMFKVTFERGDPTGFMDFKSFRVKKSELINENMLTFQDYFIVFPPDSYVFINERRLQSRLTGVYEMFDVFGDTKYYGVVIKDMMIEPKIMVQRYDSTVTKTTSLAPTRIENYFLFPYTNYEFLTYTITVPKGALISIADKMVSDFFITETKEINGVEVNVYTVHTVYGEQKVRAQYKGKEVEVLRDGNDFTIKF